MHLISRRAEISTLDKIQASKTLRVCIWPDYFAISYRDPKTRQLSGIDIDMAKALGKWLGATVEFVDSSFANLIGDVTGDRCDIAMFAVGITPLRQEKLRFTQPHLASDIYAITTKGNRRIKTWNDIDKPGTLVAVAKGTLHEPVMKEKLKQATLKVLDTPHARIRSRIRPCGRIYDGLPLQPAHAENDRLGAPDQARRCLSP